MSMDAKRVRLFQIAATLFLASAVAAAASNTTAAIPMQGCPNKCGEVDIPYPFGIGTDCFMQGFDITCAADPPRAFLSTGNMEVIRISLVDHELTVRLYMATQCSDDRMNANSSVNDPYLFSATSNKFTVVGCSTLGYIGGKKNDNDSYTTGCISMCHEESSVSEGPSCDGSGCCQTSIPKGLNDFTTYINFDNVNAQNFSPCSYAFLADQDWFQFDKSKLTEDFGKINNNQTPAVLDWAIRSPASCPEAEALPGTYACRGGNTTCLNSTNGDGYRCMCSEGYTGNPYIEGGCQDIDECQLPLLYPCFGVCTNKPGGYDCTCPPGTLGNATEYNCTNIPSKFPAPARLAFGFSALFVAVGLLLFLATCKNVIVTQKSKHKNEREIFFGKNGGFKLYEEILSKKVDTVQVFTEEELQRATDNFDDKRVIGCGRYGMVYRGILDDLRVVAIKKSKKVDERQKDEFVNEIIDLSQINHTHIVRFMGCCLELDVPMLVYEYVSNGSLFEVLHPEHHASRLPFQARLTIAQQTAEALAYLHSATTRSITHGDVKSHNILLDTDLSAKVSGFGASHLVPVDENEFIAFVQETLGYLDPECMLTRRLTDRSDVYSFGVVLLELITGKKAIYTDAGGEKKSLATSFLVTMKEQRPWDILDVKMVEQGGEQLLGEVVAIAMECLSVKGEERPSMKEVAERLHSLRRFRLQPKEENYRGEIEMI
ncbi:hypothetical protein OPV22_034092 [Ensete ventricosum]|uniref:Protein kinase domain-containing protein n=1 Tax=Ensete ventricosum TaxID=4639 RepID=A0AAV8P3Y7_ENSVE|nr:hypothetical protein OPV22_034092 [Ensete ventricosum]